MPKPTKLLLFIFFVTQFVNAQNRIVTGVVKDTLNKPLDYANVMAIPKSENAKMLYAITEANGSYTLEVDARYTYELSVSYMGYEPQVQLLEPNDGKKTIHFILTPQENQLDEIIIDYDYQPIVVKKDTIIYNLNAFVNGNERKLKDALEKLPGVEVQKNGDVTVQGKKVTQLHVENKKFFGGGTKLAVENIPADAVEKVEVIDNFVEVDFLKKVSSSDDLAMNIKLKEDKKKFIFGDIEAGAEVANDNEFYLANAALFYYSPKRNVSVIGDLNSIGRRVFSYTDLRRFEGGVSSFITGRKSISDLGSFASENKDVKQNKSQFVALNYNESFGKKVDLFSYGVFSKIFLQNQSNTNIEYKQQNSASIFEIKNSNSETTNTLGLWNTKLDWTPNKKHKVFYNFNLKLSNQKYNQNLETISALNPNTFSIKDLTDETDFKQYLEWHHDLNKKNIQTFVVNHLYNDNKPQNTWLSSNPFLTGFLPLQADDSYNIQQVNRDKQNNLDALFKHYWILNEYNHLYFNIGNNYTDNFYQTQTIQQLSNQPNYNFSADGFYNHLNYHLNDFYIGVDYKFYLGKSINTPSLYWHQYNASINQDTQTTISKGVWLPQWKTEIDFSKSKKFRFNYRMQTSFATASLLASGKELSSYSSVYKGNALQENELFHYLTTSYSKFSLYRGWTYFFNASFVKKENTRRNEVVFDGINRYTTTVLSNLPEQRANLSARVEKRVSELVLEANASTSWSEYHQSINNIYNKFNRNAQILGAGLRTTFDSLPHVRIEYQRSFNRINAIQKTNFETDSYNISLDYEFLKHFIAEASYQKFVNHSAFANANDYEILNASLRYQRKNNPWTFELQAQNLLGAATKVQSSISDYIVSETTFYILPRLIMLSVKYKL